MATHLNLPQKSHPIHNLVSKHYYLANIAQTNGSLIFTGQTPKETDNNSNPKNSNTRRYSQTNGFYSPEGDKPHSYLSNAQLFANTSTDSLYNQLKVKAHFIYDLINVYLNGYII